MEEEEEEEEDKSVKPESNFIQKKTVKPASPMGFKFEKKTPRQQSPTTAPQWQKVSSIQKQKHETSTLAYIYINHIGPKPAGFQHSKPFHTVCGGFQLDETTAMLEKSAAELEDAKKESRSNSDSMKVDLAKQNELQRTKENEIADLKTAVGFPCCTIHCCISASFTQPEHGTRNIGIARAERERSCS